jgi:hypothetical protein
MSTLRIAPLPAPPPTVADRAVWSGETAFFVVREAGLHGGRWYDRGDVLACAVRPVRSGEAAILVPHGRGGPRLGRVVGRELRGTADEPCSPIRWSPLGAVVAQWRAQELVAVRSPGRTDVPTPQGPQLRAPSAGPQLSLFARAA